MSFGEHVKRFSSRSVSMLAHYQAKVPNGIWQECPHCHASFYFKRAGQYRVCPECGYGFRVTAHRRLKMLTKHFEEWDADLETKDPTEFPEYDRKIKKAQSATHLKDGVLTGKATIGDYPVALGIMDPLFIMGSLGTANGERITRMFEKATKQQLPVVLLTASGGARMQEGIYSLMQMAKISQAVNVHSAAGLGYISVIMDPTTGGVTASFASQADITLAEPKALYGFTGKRVIEQTINKELPSDFQSVENSYKRGFIDEIVPRERMAERLTQLLSILEAKKWGEA
ncbi:acetyl-CoA carboxylase, carboxyl transferase subunit beta [Secundilactobacillus pentosiphilus]|uniref:Acetyl-coenzyme A carboxylase carboxyl transferase subunit beta n=1 Tax=Secundilactobacillus pentosiphilus TaxID=1714682 RepID=A0A1Z5IM68_9LACO|nr:acetyl-CoA carboxylase, carboxyl transferase subunit beta [Secundilactobacillus pentosiphilus]